MNGNPEDVPSMTSETPAQAPDIPPEGMTAEDAPVSEAAMRAYAAHVEARFDALQAQLAALAGEVDAEDATEEMELETNGDDSGETQPGDAPTGEEIGSTNGDSTADSAPRPIHPYFRKVGNGRD